MFYMPPPIPPEPPRGSFESQEDYEKAMRAHRKIITDRDKADKDMLALDIVTGACFAIVSLGTIGAVGFLLSGWRGAAGVYLSIGLFFAAVSRVRQYL
jgi:hypothetical protein